MVNKINLTDMQAAIDSRQLSESKQTLSSGQEREQAEILTDKVWEKLSAMYGYKFVSQFGEMPDSTWASCLKGITARQIADGLNNCLEMHPEWPPGAAQFRAACLGKHLDADGNDSSWQHKSAAYKDINDPSHPNYRPKMIESDYKVSKRKKTAKRELGKIKDMFK